MKPVFSWLNDLLVTEINTNVFDKVSKDPFNDENRAVAVVYAEESVQANLDNLIDCLQDRDMDAESLHEITTRFFASALTLTGATGLPFNDAFKYNMAESVAVEVGDFIQTMQSAPSSEEAGLYNLSDDNDPISQAVTNATKKAWNERQSDELKEFTDGLAERFNAEQKEKQSGTE